MEFRRIEIKRALRYREFLTDSAEMRTVFEKLKEKDMRFSMRIAGMGPTFRECVIQSLDDKGLMFFSGTPMKIRTRVALEDIECLEVESNCNFLAEEPDSGGRWARIM